MNYLNEFVEVGRELYEQGLNHAASGNLSILKGDSIYITRHDSRLGRLKYEDIVRVNLNDERRDKEASIEVKVHRAIYQRTSWKAIVHAHPIWCTALSLKQNRIVPIDAEGFYYLPEIPVVEVIDTIGTKGLVEMVPKYLEKYKVIMVKGHGSFAASDSLSEASKLTAVLEKSSEIIILSKLIK